MRTADLIDDHANKLTLCHLPFIRFGQRRSFHGPVQTVKCHEDNVLLKTELAKPGYGRVLAVDAGGSTRVAVLGDMLAAMMRDNGWAGIILHGAIRDSEDIDKMDVGVFCLGTSPVKSAKDGFGTVGAAVSFGGVTFQPSGFAYCDADGVLYAAQDVLAH